MGTSISKDSDDDGGISVTERMAPQREFVKLSR